jgi:hypothetical protein
LTPSPEADVSDTATDTAPPASPDTTGGTVSHVRVTTDGSSRPATPPPPPTHADSALQAAIARVRGRTGAATVDEVYADLLRELKTAFPSGFHPNGTRLRDVAEEIAEDGR